MCGWSAELGWVVLARLGLGWAICAGSRDRTDAWTPGSSSLIRVEREGFPQSEPGKEGLEDSSNAERQLCPRSLAGLPLHRLGLGLCPLTQASPVPRFRAFQCSAQTPLLSLK